MSNMPNIALGVKHQSINQRKMTEHFRPELFDDIITELRKNSLPNVTDTLYYFENFRLEEFFIQNLLKWLFNCWKRNLTEPAFQNLQLSIVNSTSTLVHVRVTLLWPNNYNNQCQCRRINIINTSYYMFVYMITSTFVRGALVLPINLSRLIW